jgi:hypothetical protein
VDVDDGDLLAILSSESARAAIDDLADAYPVTHEASWRVLVIRHGGGDFGDVAAIPGVAVVSGADVASEILEGLNKGEALFVQAWSQRRGSPKERRRGEGLDWDAEGFEPPDPPPDEGLDGE